MLHSFQTCSVRNQQNYLQIILRIFKDKTFILQKFHHFPINQAEKKMLSTSTYANEFPDKHSDTSDQRFITILSVI